MSTQTGWHLISQLVLYIDGSDFCPGLAEESPEQEARRTEAPGVSPTRIAPDIDPRSSVNTWKTACQVFPFTLASSELESFLF